VLSSSISAGLESKSGGIISTPAANKAAVCYTRALKDLGALVGAVVPECILIITRDTRASFGLNLRLVLNHAAKPLTELQSLVD
jgi:hypothetical protein